MPPSSYYWAFDFFFLPFWYFTAFQPIQIHGVQISKTVVFASIIASSKYKEFVSDQTWGVESSRTGSDSTFGFDLSPSEYSYIVDPQVSKIVGSLTSEDYQERPFELRDVIGALPRGWLLLEGHYFKPVHCC